MIISNGGIAVTNVMGGRKSLAAQLSAVFGGILYQLNDDTGIADAEESPLLQWSSSVGPTPSYIDGVKVNVASVNGKKCCAPNTASARLRNVDGVKTLSGWFVAECSINSTQYETPMLGNSSADPLYVRYMSTNQWIEAPYPIVHYLDGAISATIPTSGVHIFECVANPTAVSPGMVLLCNPTLLARFTYMKMMCAIRLTAPPTNAQRAAATAALKNYYGIP